jgi:hypothetical protein
LVATNGSSIKRRNRQSGTQRTPGAADIVSALQKVQFLGGTAVVDQLLGGLFGGQDDDDEPVRRQRANDFIERYERGRPYDGIDDDEVIQNYRATAGRLSPQEYEEAAAESLGRLSREERRELRRRMRQQGGQIDNDDDDDPRRMARELSQYQQQQGSDDPLGGLGGMLGGMFGGGGNAQASSSGGDLLGGPLGKAVLGGVAAVAMKKMMGGG